MSPLGKNTCPTPANAGIYRCEGVRREQGRRYNRYITTEIDVLAASQFPRDLNGIWFLSLASGFIL